MQNDWELGYLQTVTFLKRGYYLFVPEKEGFAKNKNAYTIELQTFKFSTSDYLRRLRDSNP